MGPVSLTGWRAGSTTRPPSVSLRRQSLREDVGRVGVAGRRDAAARWRTRIRIGGSRRVDLTGGVEGIAVGFDEHSLEAVATRLQPFVVAEEKPARKGRGQLVEG